MAGRQAKVLSKETCDDLLVLAAATRHPVRNRLIVKLSLKAGLRAGEITNLTWEMVLDRNGDVQSRSAHGAQALRRSLPKPCRAYHETTGRTALRQRPWLRGVYAKAHRRRERRSANRHAPTQIAQGLPRTWDEVAIGHQVIAQASLEYGWWGGDRDRSRCRHADAAVA
jgi:hypothetical protein